MEVSADTKPPSHLNKLPPTKLSPTGLPNHHPPLPQLSTLLQTPIPMDVGEVTVSSSEEDCLSPGGMRSPPGHTPFSPHHTPRSPHLSTLISEATNASMFSFDTQVKQEPPSTGLMDALGAFCRHALGHGVLGLQELRDKLLLHQVGGSDHDPLRTLGISDSLLVTALHNVGAVEVGQMCGRRMFALEHTGDHTDKVGHTE